MSQKRAEDCCGKEQRGDKGAEVSCELRPVVFQRPVRLTACYTLLFPFSYLTVRQAASQAKAFQFDEPKHLA